MKKKSTKLIIALAAVAVLVGGYFAATHFLNDDTSEEETAAESETVKVETISVDDMASMNYMYGEENIKLVKKDGTWLLASDKKFPVDQTKAETMADAAAGLTAKRLVSESSSVFAEYGLDRPSSSYVFTDVNGNTVTYLFGDENTFSHAFYMNVAGTENVYLIEQSFIDTFTVGKDDLADVPEIPMVSSGDITSAAVDADGKKISLKYYASGKKDCYTSEYTWFSGDEALDNEAVMSYLSTVADFSSDGCADYSLAKDENEKYGFDKPSAVISLTYNESEDKPTGEKDEDGNDVTETVTANKKLKLTLGDENGQGDRYMKTDASNAVYLVKNDYLESLTSFDEKTLAPLDLCLIGKDSVESMIITADGKRHEIKVVRTTDEKGSETVSYTMDGKSLAEPRYDNFFNTVHDIKAEKAADKSRVLTADGNYITIVYKRNTGDKFSEMTLSIAEYDDSYYIAELNEGTKLNSGNKLLVNILDVDKIIEAFKALG
ncbi:MAG: DUF4340 domain-containing protein [Clostridiales bacterium]|nr:DUF4340 domain-containing protein [Clostridiales bacterium]